MDTPDIQQWSYLDINSYLNSSARRQIALCMFYGASSGSFAKLKQLDILYSMIVFIDDIFSVY